MAKWETGLVQMNQARFFGNSLTMSYFHTGTRTIIGAKAFHCPVRDGKEWDHLAMVIRLDWLPRRPETPQQIHRVLISLIAYLGITETRTVPIQCRQPSKL